MPQQLVQSRRLSRHWADAHPLDEHGLRRHRSGRLDPVMSSRIENYALIGDGETAALVSKDGSIDWLCWPRFDSGACFAALLGDANNGHWQIAPASTVRANGTIRVRRRYRQDTLILE